MRNVINKLGDSEVRTAFSGGSVSGVAQILEQSDCLAVLPTYVLKQLEPRYAVTSLQIKIATPTRSLALITNEDDVRPHLLSLFLEFLEFELKSLQT